MTFSDRVFGWALSWVLAPILMAAGDAPPLSARFAGEPPGALIHKIEESAGNSAQWHSPQKKYRPLDSLPALRIDLDPAHGGGAEPPDEILVAGWEFRLAESLDSLRYRDLGHRDDTWWGSTYWSGPDWTRVGRDWQHPGTNTPSVRGFRAPRGGRLSITGRVFKADTNGGGGDGVRLSIRHEGKAIWNAELDGTDTRGLEPDLALDVQKGDAIRFTVHKRGKIFYDTTHWDPIITYQDGQRFQASLGFSSRVDRDSPWFYQMEVGPGAGQGLPRLHGLGPHLHLRESVVAPGAPVAWTAGTSLPLAILSDGRDESGVVLAWAGKGRWRLHSSWSGSGKLLVRIFASAPERPPGAFLGAYRGAWVNGLTLLERFLDSGAGDPVARDLEGRFTRVLRSIVDPGETGENPDSLATFLPREIDFWAMILQDWDRADRLNGTARSYAEAARHHLARAEDLLEDLREKNGEDFLLSPGNLLKRLKARVERAGADIEDLGLLYLRARWLKRRIALSNPLMRFPRLLFTKRVPTSYSHLVMQYFGWRARPGGGLFILQEPGRSLAAREILPGRFEKGNILEPRLSHDGTRIVFSFVRCPEEPYRPGDLANDSDEGFYHIYRINVDGTGLRQLTSGPYDDVMPVFLPGGDIVFCSTRRQGYARCFGAQFSRRWHVYTLHRMNGDGGNIRTISVHDTNEWFPAISRDGRILYSRWDYIDRDAVTHQNLWATRPDGTNPVALWGNATASPHCTFQIQPVPDSRKIVFTASAHHSITAGSIVLADVAANDNGHLAITRITPGVPFPEAETNRIPEYYAAPWPLSEKYFLAAYSPGPLVWEPGANARNALGLYLIDAFGNRELIYRDPRIGSTNPCPLVPRPAPPVLPSQLPPGEPHTGEMLLLDIYQGLENVPRGSVRELRIIQIFPKITHVANTPPVGLAGEENARAILGTVPVESDGSARFLAPARTPILFQALDGDGRALQTMRSLTYVQPGEKVSCIGCHEDRHAAPPAKQIARAFRRPPSSINPGALGGRPFSFVEMVQPILDRHCVSCHPGEGKPGSKANLDLTGAPLRGFTRSYWSLCGDRNFWGAGTNPKNAAEALVPRFGARNQVQRTPPGGQYGSRRSRLLRLIREGHGNVKLGAGELRRIAAWIDCNAIFYGTTNPADQARQLRGERIAMPEIQ